MARPAVRYHAGMAAALVDYAINFLDYDHAVPSIPGFARLIGVSSKVVGRWIERNNEMREAADRVKDAQLIMLLNHGLRGSYNSQIVKLMLYNHGYTDKTAVTGEAGEAGSGVVKPISITVRPPVGDVTVTRGS